MKSRSFGGFETPLCLKHKLEGITNGLNTCKDNKFSVLIRFIREGSESRSNIVLVSVNDAIPDKPITFEKPFRQRVRRRDPSLYILNEMKNGSRIECHPLCLNVRTMFFTDYKSRYTWLHSM